MTSFWNQPTKRYRNFQIVYTVLTLNFIIPSFMYAFAPMTAVRQFFEIGQILGGGYYPIHEESYVWRCLAVGNVFTLGIMCFLLQADIQKHFPILWPLVVMKSSAALGYLRIYTSRYDYPAFLAVFLFDSLTVGFMIYFAVRARRELERAGAWASVPRPHSLSARRATGAAAPPPAVGRPTT
ncbi:MAG: hypothetical protein HYY13_00730 [Nitrospirae bacterium]|nr:hypothetical protein [Nitrospirota bacterium]